ncbi:sterol o-acyltransferase [Anaeramoeba flamelloides]|uniref:Sterol o-acyltransferase n=1 Tax=Anaeramoeba flamelloides TaxID=1746091 RepID=A0ABQ8Z9K9_9EUKA|nr:sterol o-acyltransferase [Anaeramoeba flamelloides]
MDKNKKLNQKINTNQRHKKIPTHWSPVAPLDEISLKDLSFAKGLIPILIWCALETLVGKMLGLPILDNLQIEPKRFFRAFANFSEFIYILPITSILPILCFYTKRLYMNKQLSARMAQNLVLVLSFMNLFFLFVFRSQNMNPWCGLLLAIQCCQSSFKSYSYLKSLFQEMHRAKDEEHKKAILEKHKQQGTLFEFLNFLARPWLVYEVEYIKRQTIRIGYVITKILIGFLAGFLFFCSVHVGFRILYIDESPWHNLIQKMVCIAIPSLFLWSMTFVTFFHSWLNVLAEITKYAPRAFYHYWWNATSLAIFWREWNRPVNAFAVRYIYIPAVSKGRTKFTAQLIVFTISGMFHEYLLYGLFGSFNFWVLLVFIGQPVTIYFEGSLKGLASKLYPPALKISTIFICLSFLQIMYISKYISLHPEEIYQPN